MTPIEHKKKLQLAAQKVAWEADFNKRLLREVSMGSCLMAVTFGIIAYGLQNLIAAFLCGAFCHMAIHSFIRSKQMWTEWMKVRDQALDTAQLIDTDG